MSDISLNGFKAKDFGATQEKLTRSQMLKQFMDAETLSSYPQGFKKRIQSPIPRENYRSMYPYDDDATYKPGAFAGLVDE